MDLETLPPDVQFKMTSLQLRRDERKGVAYAVYLAIRDCQARCTRLENLGRFARSDAERAEHERKLEAGRDEHERLTQQKTIRDAESKCADRDFNRCEDFILRHGRARLRVVARRPTDYSAEKLAQVRGDIAKLQAELQQVETSPLDRKSVTQEVARRVREIAASCRLAVTGLHGESPLTFDLEATERGLHRPFALELAAWLDPEKTTARLLACIPDEPGMSAEDKAESRTRLAARLLSAERAEEAQISAAHEAGMSVERRRDADERAVLGIALVEQREATEAAAA